MQKILCFDGRRRWLLIAGVLYRLMLVRRWGEMHGASFSTSSSCELLSGLVTAQCQGPGCQTPVNASLHEGAGQHGRRSRSHSPASSTSSHSPAAAAGCAPRRCWQQGAEPAAGRAGRAGAHPATATGAGAPTADAAGWAPCTRLRLRRPSKPSRCRAGRDGPRPRPRAGQQRHPWRGIPRHRAPAWECLACYACCARPVQLAGLCRVVTLHCPSHALAMAC
jgi:hypothetical protein